MLNDTLRFAQDEDLAEIALGNTVAAGESRTGQFTGTKALMLAVLEDGIRSYLGNKRIIADEAECWIFSRSRESPFTFMVVCETLGLDPDAVRVRVRGMKHAHVSNRALRRSRHNVRIPGRVAA